MGRDDRLSAGTRRVVLALVFGAALPLLDTSIVNVAIHSLGAVFDTDMSRTQWVITAYALASAVAVPLSGWATRRFGAARVWIAALAGFTLASVLCGSAWSIESLIGFRLLQGFAAGLSIPVMQTVLITSAGKGQATRAMTAAGLPAVIAPALGPLLGGVLVDAAGWRSIFFVNVPIGVMAIVLAARILRQAPPDRNERLDALGFALLAPGLLVAVYGLTAAGHGLVWLLIGLVLVAGYVRHARRAAAPLVDLAVFGRRSFVSAWSTLIIASMVFYGGLFLIPLYYQDNLGLPAFAAGLLLGLQGLGAYASRILANRLVAVRGVRATAYLFIGCTVLGTAPFALPVPQDGPWLAVAGLALIVRGGGVGALTVLTMSATYHRLPAGDVVHASTAGRIATQFGSALGVAVCAVLVTVTAGITPATFAYLGVVTALMAATAIALPRGKVVRN